MEFYIFCRLTGLHDAMLEYRQRWILDGPPRGDEHQSFANYKSAKYLFRDELRKANENYEINASNLIKDSLEFDQKTAWSLINCRRSRKSKAVILKTNGNLLTHPNDVSNEFAKHFEQIAKIPNDAPDDPTLSNEYLILEPNVVMVRYVT